MASNVRFLINSCIEEYISPISIVEHAFVLTPKFHLEQYLQNVQTRGIVFENVLNLLNEYNYIPLAVEKLISLLKTYIVIYTPDDAMLKLIDDYFINFVVTNNRISEMLLFIRCTISATLKINNNPLIVTNTNMNILNNTRKGTLVDDSDPTEYIITNIYTHILKRSIHRPRINLSSYIEAEVMHITDSSFSEKRLHTVGISKKIEERAEYKSVRKPRPLFQFKHYMSQSRLKIGEDTLDKIISNIIDPPDNQCLLVASKILSKLVLDMYCESTHCASELVFSIILEIIETENPEAISVGLNIIFNLSIHVNFLEEIPLHDPKEKATTPLISRIQEELFVILSDSLLKLVYKNIDNHGCWVSALNAVLYFISDKGNIDKRRLLVLDIRVLHCIFKYVHNINYDLYRYLVRYFCNRLLLGNGNINFKLLKDNSIYIRDIIDMYITSKSLEADENLFYFIFQYAVRDYNEKYKTMGNKMKNILLESLWNLGMCKRMKSNFIYLPEISTDDPIEILELLLDKSLSTSNKRFAKKIQPKKLERFMMCLYSLAEEYIKVGILFQFLIFFS
eukprot:TRINITY_DN2923_c0_g1_i1.p1 TRINITY_DN2923_c0_g1~~TRINITY_DN2923_c0_g1_i1.p1  ORF type:complete len:565 (-),score=88.53 TRINITY_DN2923_c0_g1_i1:939-2633(-)